MRNRYTLSYPRKFGSLEVGKEPLICVPLNNIDNSTIKKLKEFNVKLVEVRFDYFYRKMSLKDTLKVLNDESIPFIFTFRRKEEGGFQDVSDDIRAKMIEQSIDFKPAMIDIELQSLKMRKDLFQSVVERAKELDVGVIVSYHDFDKTDNLEDLIKIGEEEYESGADILKIATMVRSISDALTLLQLTKELRDIYSLPLIIIGMGELGKIVRISSVFFGSDIIFADLVGSTAPGQLKYSDVNYIINMLF